MRLQLFLGSLLAAAVAVVGLSVPAAGAGPGFVYDRDLSWWAVNSLELASEYTGSETGREA